MKKIKKILALTLVFCMAIMQMAAMSFAANADVNNVNMTLKDNKGTAVEMHKSYVTANDSLLEIIGSEVNAKYRAGALNVFGSPAMKAILTEGLANYKSSTGWEAFAKKYEADFSGSELFNVVRNSSCKAKDLEKDVPYKMNYTNNVQGDPAYGTVYTLTVVRTEKPAGGGGDIGGGGGGGGEIAPPPVIPPVEPDVEHHENPDGSVTDIEKQEDGTVIETTKKPNGDVTKVESKTDGSMSSTETRTDGTKVESNTTAKGETTAEVTVPAGKKDVVINIPKKEITEGQVAVIVKPDGTKEIIRKSAAGENGMIMQVEGSAKIEIIDNTKKFDDVTKVHWAEKAVGFVASREIFNGVSEKKFAPEDDMTRGMIVKVIHNFENNPAAAKENGFTDVESGIWYDEAVEWATENSIVTGYSKDLFGPDDNVTREQLAAILYRYSGSPSVNGNVSAKFSDASSISSYAANAMNWAIETGLINGMGNNTLNPQGNATRAQVAAIMMRFCKNILAA